MSEEPTTDQAGESPYKRLFWILCAASVTFVAMGVYSTISTSIEAKYLKENIESLKAAVITRIEFSSLQADVSRIARSFEEGTRSRYTSDQAALDRKAISDQFLQHSADIRKNTDSINELMIFKAQMEARGKP